MISKKESNFISAVVYIYNNENSIEDFIKIVNELLGRHFMRYEIICVNDFSMDKSIECLKKAVALLKDVQVSVINMSYFHGREKAMSAGIDFATGDFVYEFDSTLIDYPTELIMNVYNKSLEGNDIVVASPDWKVGITSKTFYKVFNYFSHTQYDIDLEMFRILSRRFINRAHMLNTSIPFRKAIYSNCGLKKYTMKYVSQKHYNIKPDKNIIKANKQTALISFVLFTDVVFKSAVFLSAVSIIGGILSLFILGINAIRNHTINKTSLYIFILLLGFGGLFAISAAIVKYLEVILKFLFNKKHYSFESIDKLSNT